MMELLSFTAPETNQKLLEDVNVENLQRSALSRCLNEGHYKNVSLILKCMAKYQRQNAVPFQHMFGDLLDYQSFSAYLANMLVQTKMMESK